MKAINARDLNDRANHSDDQDRIDTEKIQNPESNHAEGAFTTNQRLASLRILLCEDCPNTQIIMLHILEISGAKADVASDGGTALQMALDNFYHCILMDMRMPVMSGYEVTQQLRTAGCSTPILALTGSVMMGDREKCLKAGCNDYVSRPFALHSLLDSIIGLAKKV